MVTLPHSCSLLIPPMVRRDTGQDATEDDAFAASSGHVQQDTLHAMSLYLCFIIPEWRSYLFVVIAPRKVLPPFKPFNGKRNVLPPAAATIVVQLIGSWATGLVG